MASLGRARRGHLSSKVANVKLRPAPAQAQEGQSRRKSRFEAEEYDVNMMDREHVRRLNDEDTLEDHLDPELSHAKTSLPFRDQVVSFTGITWEKPALSEKLRAMGVKHIHMDLTLDATALISRGHESLKYERSVEYRIPIFRPDWIDAVHEIWLSGLEVPPVHSLTRYKLEAFAGLTIAVSGIEPAETRQSMIQKIGDLGGKYSPSLNRECTHLIVSNPKPNAANPLSSAKVTWAFQVNAQANEEREHLRMLTDVWSRRGGVGPDPGAIQAGMEGKVRGIKIVWEGWFWDCLQFDGRFKEDNWNAEEFREPPRFEKSYTYQENVRKARQKEEMDRAKQVMQAAMRANEDTSDPFEKAPDELGMLDMEELQAKPEELEPALIRKRPRESQSTMAARRSKTSGGPGGLVDDLIASVSHRDDRSPMKTGHDAGVLVKTEPVDKGPKSGSRSPSPETARKRARTAKAHSTEMATAWAPRPTTSDQQRTRSSIIDTSRDRAFGENQAGPSKPTVFPSVSKDADSGSAAPLGPAQVSVSAKGKEPSMPPSRQMSTSSSTYDPTVFEGLTFTHQIEGPVELFEDAVRGMGGALVPYAQWQDGEPADYVVCRLMNSQPPEVNYAANSQVVTECWIERCLKERRLCSPDDSVVFRPLPKPMPIQGIGGQVIHLSGFDEENLYYLKRLIKALGKSLKDYRPYSRADSISTDVIGAQFAPGFSKSKTTALVSGRNYGLKVNKAVEWNLPIVTAEWLYSMARSGQLEPLSGYAITPEPEPEGDTEALRRTASEPLTTQISQKTGLERLVKPRLEATGTMNLSTISDTGSMFGLGSSHSPRPGSDQGQNEPAAARRTASATASRKLGLAPTEMDLDVNHREGRTDERSTKGRSTSASTSTSSNTGATPIRTDAGPAEVQLGSATRDVGGNLGDMGPPRSISRGTLSETASEAEGLAKIGNRSGPAEPSKAQAYNPRRNRNGRPRSALSSRTVNPFLEAMNDSDRFQDHPGPLDAEMEDPSGVADDSMRVMYVDPKAEQERKKLVDAFQERTPPTGKKTRSRAI